MEILTITSEWGFLGAILVVTLVSQLLSLWRSQWQVLDRSEGRVGALDGLRGLLSYSVYVHHAIITYFWIHWGRWADPPSRLYVLCGNVPVAMFFQLTAFLFWRKVLDATAPIDYTRLMIGRVRRLSPAYLVAVVFTLVLIAAACEWKVNVPYWQLLHEVACWFSFGLNFTFPVTTNTLPQAAIVNSVLWTLGYEWRFYMLLPLFAVFRRDLLFPIVLFGVMFLWPDVSLQHMPVNFGFGMIAARISKSVPMQTGWARYGLDVLAAATLYYLFTTQPNGYNWTATMMVAVIVLAVVLGSTLFGLLNLRGLRLMGVTSYSFYLLHSPILFLCLWPLREQVASDTIKPTAYLLLMTGIGVLIQLVSMVSYKLTEEPYLRHPVRKLPRAHEPASGTALTPDERPAEQVKVA